MGRIRSFRELQVYQIALGEATEIFQLTTKFPRSERYSLTSQIRRSSRAVCALIGEAWASRTYEKAFVSKGVQALAEATETQVWLEIALRCGYISPESFAEKDDVWEHIGAMLHNMMSKSNKFTLRR